MGAKEIRIGNIVDSLGDEEIVDSIYNSCISTNKTKYCQPDEIKGIEINEDLLIEMGFEKSRTDDGEYYYSLNLSDQIYCDLAFISSDFKVVGLFPYETFFKFKYVHEIQNAYFSITGKELEIKK